MRGKAACAAITGAPRAAARPTRQAALLGIVGLVVFPRLLGWEGAFAGVPGSTHGRADVIRLRASPSSPHEYGPILGRDPTVQKALLKSLGLVEKGLLRSVRAGVAETSEKGEAKRAAYLAKLGIKPKKPKKWDVEHMAPGDKYGGYAEHPDFGRIDLKVTIDAAGVATWSSSKGNFADEVVEVVQDHSIADEQDQEQRKKDIAAYVFSKFNFAWRDYAINNAPMPTKEDVEYLDLPGMQLWFLQVASVEGYPSEEEYKAGCTDPSKGMSIDDFVKFVSEDPTYLDVTFPSFYTGRRIRIFDSKLQLDGDFSEKTQGNIIGFANYRGAPGGEFLLTLSA